MKKISIFFLTLIIILGGCTTGKDVSDLNKLIADKYNSMQSFSYTYTQKNTAGQIE